MSEPTNEPQPDTEPNPDVDNDADPQGNPGEDALGDAGKQALDRMKAERNEAKQSVKTLEQRLSDAEKAQASQLDAIAKALGLKDDETPDAGALADQLAESQRTAADNAAALIRYKTAVDKQVPSHLVEFVTGSTAEEVEASIEKVLGAFSASKPSGPQPDPSQGHQGAPTSLAAQIAAAEERKDTKEVIRLKARQGMTTN